MMCRLMKIGSVTFGVWFLVAILLLVGTQPVLAVGEDKDVTLPVYASLSAGADVKSMAFSPDNRILANGNGWNANYSGDFSIKLWDVVSGQPLQTLKGHTKDVYDLAYSPDGQVLASASNDYTIKFWNMTTHKEISTIKTQNDVQHIAFSGDGKTLISASGQSWDKTVIFWDVLSGTKLAQAELQNTVTDISWNVQNGDIAILQLNGAVTIRDKNGNYKKTVLAGDSGYQSMYANLQFSPDGKKLAVANISKPKPQIFNVDQDYQQLEIEDNQFIISNRDWEKVMFSGNSKFLVGISYYDLYIYDLKTGALLARVPNYRFDDAGNTVAISSDMKKISVYDNGKVQLLDASSLPLKSLQAIKIEPENITLQIGENQKVKVIGLYSDETQDYLEQSKVKWQTSDFNIAIVDNGVITARSAAGTAVLTATTLDGSKSATCTITVTTPVTGVNLNKSVAKINVGANETLNITISPTNATNKGVTWDSSDPDIATVDSNGKVVGVKAGTAVITVTTVDGNKIATCIVEVSTTVSPIIQNISLDKNWRISFSKPVNSNTIQGNILLWRIDPVTQTKVKVDITPVIDPINPKVVIVEHSTPFVAGASYELLVNVGIKDVSGKSLSKALGLSFMTQAP